MSSRKLPEPPLGAGLAAVATIGVFDGVHRGHRALCEVVLERARERGVAALAITFDPHPMSVFAPGIGAHRLVSARSKLRLLLELGLDAVWVLPFSRALASMSASRFVRDLLLRHVDLRELWVGYDFRFGRGREGGMRLLRREGEALGFEVHQFGPVHEEKRILSSTWVREAVRGGAIEEAVHVLGHSFWLEGPVAAGRGEGARILVATANLRLPAEQVLPADGVYAAWAELRGELHPAVVNVGVRPTLTSDRVPTVEAHLIAWSGRLAGEVLTLHFGTRLREERRFEGLEQLRAAVAQDIQRASGWLKDRVPFMVAAPPDPRRAPERNL